MPKWNCSCDILPKHYIVPSDYHNTVHVTCSSIMCTSSWASTCPYSWDVWDVVGPCYSNVWDAMMSKDYSMVAPISPPFLINIFFFVKECDVFHDKLISKQCCNTRKKSSNGTILRLKWSLKKNGNIFHIKSNTKIDGNILHLKSFKRWRRKGQITL